MSLKTTLVVGALVAFGAFAAPGFAQTPSDPKAPPLTGDKMPTSGQLPEKPAKVDRKAERIKAREARRPEATEAAKNPDYSGGTFDPAGKPKPKAKPAAKPASAN